MEEEQQALETLVKEQKGGNSRMCRRVSGTMELLVAQPWLPQDAKPQQVWCFYPTTILMIGCCMRPFSHSQGHLSERNKKSTCNTHKTRYTKRCKATAYSKRTKGGIVWIRMCMPLCLLLGLLKGGDLTSPVLSNRTTNSTGQTRSRSCSGAGLGGVDGVGEVAVINLTVSPSKSALPEDKG